VRSCLVAVCCNSTTIFRKTAQSFMELGWGDRIPYARDLYGFESVGHQWFTEGPRVDMMRNQAAAAALKGVPREAGGDPVPFSHLIFLDADMVWPTTVIADLLKHHDQGIVSGMYCLKAPPHTPVHLQEQADETFGPQMFNRLITYGTELEPVDVVGMGCTIIPVDAFRQTGPGKWFEYKDDREGYPRVSEDVPFCLKAKAAGIPRYVDPTIRCGHITAQVIDDRWHTRYQQSIKSAETAGPLVTVKETA